MITPPMAGAFGMLNADHRYPYLALFLSRKSGRPVIYKMTLDEFGLYKARDMAHIQVKMGGKKDGEVTAFDYNQLHENGAYGWKSTNYIFEHDIFARSNVRVNDQGVNINLFSTGCIRGVGNVQQTMALNQTSDVLMEEMGVDPITFWKKNIIRTGDPYRTLGLPGGILSSDAYDDIFDSGTKAIGWQEKWQGWGKPYYNDGPKRRGVGMAVAIHCSGTPVLPASALVEINHDGTAQVVIGSIDLGTGCKISFAQVCAETLGLKIDDVTVVRDVDTETVPYMCFTCASISIHLGGAAIVIAANDAKTQILEMAASAPWSPEVLTKGVSSAEELDIENGEIYVKADPSRRAAIKELVSSVLAPIVIGRATRHGLEIAGPIAAITLGGFADVEVDTETGKVTLLKYVAGNDSGRLVNPDVCENQVYSGIIQGLGYGLNEEVAFDPTTGKTLNPALADYWAPTSLDAPPMEIIFPDLIDPVGPFGAKGIGEAAALCPHTAIASALYNAIGIRFHDLPITPDKVLKALGKLK